MLRKYGYLLVAILLGFSTIAALPGCSMYPPEPKKTGPTTVEGWMALPRVQP